MNSVSIHSEILRIFELEIIWAMGLYQEATPRYFEGRAGGPVAPGRAVPKRGILKPR